MKIIKEFKSKKNNVYLVEDCCRIFIMKEFRNCENYFREKSHYLILCNSTLEIPKIIKWDDKNCIFFMEFLEGITALDAIVKSEKEEDSDCAINILKSIFVWLKKFHSIKEIKSKKLSFHDMNFRNFILTYHGQEKFYGIDFESFEEGSLLTDLGKLIGMYLNYDEKYSMFKQDVSQAFIDFIISNKHFSKKELEESIKKSIIEIDNRRFNII